MTKPYLKNYTPNYQKRKNKLDEYIAQGLSAIEDKILLSPLDYGFLQYYKMVRKYKSGKRRIFYTISDENLDYWIEYVDGGIPKEPEIMFLDFDFRSEKTYKDLSKHFKHLKR